MRVATAEGWRGPLGADWRIGALICCPGCRSASRDAASAVRVPHPNRDQQECAHLAELRQVTR